MFYSITRVRCSQGGYLYLLFMLEILLTRTMLYKIYHCLISIAPRNYMYPRPVLRRARHTQDTRFWRSCRKNAEIFLSHVLINSVINIYTVIYINHLSSPLLLPQGPVVRKMINANPGLKLNRGFNFSCIRVFFTTMMFC